MLKIVSLKLNYPPKLELELFRPKIYRRIYGVIFLMIAILLSLYVIVNYFEHSRKISALEIGDNQFKMPTNVEDSSAAKESQSVRDTIKHLALPWDSLFSAFESVKADKISLFSMEPDAENKTVKVVAGAPNVYAMLDYARVLSEEAKLKDVLLQQFETSEDDSNQQVLFVLTASWGQL